jgi:hypothetical protein
MPRPPDIVKAEQQIENGATSTFFMNLIAQLKHPATVGTIVLALAMITLASCDLRSGIARDEEEKLKGTPTPSVSPTPTAVPIDPADIVQVDTSQNGENIVFNQRQLNKPVACTKFDEVSINIDSAAVTIKGACRQITINGDNNKIAAEATMRFVINGVGNNVGYVRFPNGQRPSVTDNGGGNIVEKISADNLANNQSNSNKVK